MLKLTCQWRWPMRLARPAGAFSVDAWVTSAGLHTYRLRSWLACTVEAYLWLGCGRRFPGDAQVRVGRAWTMAVRSPLRTCRVPGGGNDVEVQANAVHDVRDGVYLAASEGSRR